MKTKLVVLVGFMMNLFACSEDPVTSLSPIWGIEFSDLHTANLASGMITGQRNESKTTYFVDRAYLQSTNRDEYQLTLQFTRGDSLRFVIRKKTGGENFYYLNAEGQNSIVHSIFNTDTLTLQESTLSIEPKRGENKVYVTLDIHAVEGSFNGTASRIPLVGEEQ